VLLPRLGVSEGAERLFIAAFADEAGVAVLVNRIQGQFERLGRVRQAGRTLTASHVMLNTRCEDAGASATQMVASLAKSLEASITTQRVCELSL
jgi:hypothetical protein